MRQQINKILSRRYPAVTWTIIIFILLSLPGKMLPNEEHLSIPQLDKVVHIILFGSFVFLWSYYYAAKPGDDHRNRYYLRILVIACLYGIAMEYVQKYFIPNRDFDVYDIVADATGAAAGYAVARLAIPRLIKK